jgi:hypothetical protein
LLLIHLYVLWFINQRLKYLQYLKRVNYFTTLSECPT